MSVQTSVIGNTDLKKPTCTNLYTNNNGGRAQALPPLRTGDSGNLNTDSMKRKGKSMDGRTQKAWTFRLDNDNETWLDAESERQQVAKGRIVNDIIKAKREETAPTATVWSETRRKLMKIREDLKQAVIDMYATMEAYDLHDEDEQPDTYTNYRDAQP